jgi:hypothetical protein
MSPEYRVSHTRNVDADVHNQMLHACRYRVFAKGEFLRLVGIPKWQRELSPRYVRQLSRDMASVESPLSPVIYLVLRPRGVPVRNLANTGSAKYCLMDGQHRAMALLETNYEFGCMIYPVLPKINMCKCFAILNRQRHVDSNHLIGIVDTGVNLQLRQINASRGHSLFRKVYFGRGTRKGRVTARKLLTVYRHTFAKTARYFARYPNVARNYLPQNDAATLWSSKFMPFLDFWFPLAISNAGWYNVINATALWNLWLRAGQLPIRDIGTFARQGPPPLSGTGGVAVRNALQSLLTAVRQQTPLKQWKLDQAPLNYIDLSALQ